MLRKFKLILLCSFLFVSCTIAPKQISSSTIAYDASTPIQYPPRNGGLLGFCYATNIVSINSTNTITNIFSFGVITKNGRNNYNLLISKYHDQWKNEKAKDLNPDDGITPYSDIFNNQLYLIDDEHLVDFLTLDSWLRSGL